MSSFTVSNASNRFLITGQDPKNPQQVADFSASAQLDFTLAMNKIQSNLLALAKLILVGLQTPSTVRVVIDYPNCFSLAAQYYGDVEQWVHIMNSSGLTTPVVNTTEVPITLPSVVS